MAHLHGAIRSVGYHVHFCDDPAFVYVTNPKVACSTVKASLNTAVAARRGETLTLRGMADVHARRRNPMPTLRRIGWTKARRLLQRPGVMRFSFTRDPLARLVSAWGSKLAGPQPSPQARRLFAHLGLDTAHHPLPFAEFARICREDPVARDLDPHWRLQRTQLWYDLLDYGFLGDINAFDDGFRAVTARIFGAPVAVIDTRKPPFKHGRPAPAAEVTAAARRDIEIAYAPDFEMRAEVAAQGRDRLD